MSAAAFLPPHLLDRLGGLDLIARRLVSGLVAGQHPSQARGTGEEFVRHRPYQQGDPLRRLDWRVYGRTDRLYVREYRAESNLQAYLLVDSTLSMEYSDSRGVSKRRYAAFLAAALAHLMLRDGDQVGLASYGQTVQVHLLPRQRVGQLHDLLRVVDGLQARGSVSGAQAVDRIAASMRRWGRLVLISDLLEEDGGDALVAAIGRLCARGDEVIVLRPLTPAELGEESLGPAVLFDPEQPDFRVPAVPASDSGYARRVAEYYERIARRLEAHGAEYVPLSTALPVEVGLTTWLRGRRV